MADNHKSDLDRISHQNSFTDLARGVEAQPRGGGLFSDLVIEPLRAVVDSTGYGKAMHGRTNFEECPLNHMLDLVEQTDPEDLETSGKALWDARDAIQSAAKELSGHIEHVEWVGESGDAFRAWGRSLVKDAHSLSDFAGGAGDQISAAAVGLASVRHAMPPRDTTNAPRPKSFPKSKQMDSNHDYTTAVRVEKHRQEAINQMNRLSSYYAVSTDQLESWNQRAPEFTSMPDVGVPKPTSYADGAGSGGSAHGAAATHPGVVAVSHHTITGTSGQSLPHHPGVMPQPSGQGPEHVIHPDAPVGTVIDSAGTLPASAPDTGHTPYQPGPTSTAGGPSGRSETGYLPVSPGIPGGGAGGPGRFRNPFSVQGRAGTTSSGTSASERSLGRAMPGQPVRPSPGQGLGKGMSAQEKATTPMGRAVTGGTPRAAGTSAPRANTGPTTGAGRSNGVVGGRPTNTAGTPAKGGSRIPRGTVIGAEETGGPQASTGRLARRGVFGTPESTTRPDGTGATTARSVPAASEGVTGRPAARNSASRAEGSGMTRGGTALGRASDRSRGREAARPDRPAEDEETHLTTNSRRDVPPAVN
ncbi:WXG100 family type VII secretion target [Streptomyces tropicalis]|uniref:Uncharacterized protein n=1 Tax=Streptomyces tropicalis TaxID=3034234 RepID=A0ABT6ADD2_9ACTN|nr:hypothetical protein [Streptomyces tropicalis]MDF3302670.1 hypothetical protein [Streptomyces tropicalis]